MDSDLQQILNWTNAQGILDAADAVQGVIDSLQLTVSDQQTQIVTLQAQVQAAQAAATVLQNQLEASQTQLQLAGLQPVYRNLEELTNWLQPGNVGNSGGGSTAPHGAFTLTPAAPAIFAAAGAAAYNNGYWYTILDGTGKYSQATAFRYDLELQGTASDLAVSQAIEFELQLHVAGVVFNMAWQARIVGAGNGPKLWYTFNYKTKQWEPTSIPVDLAILTAPNWCAISAEFSKNANGTLTHVALTINGARHPVNVTHASVPTYGTNVNGLNAAFQLDSNNTAAPYKIHVRNIHVYVG